MSNYVAIENHIRQARIERSVYLAEILTDAIIAVHNGIKHAADVLLSVARTKTRNNVFTFDV